MALIKCPECGKEISDKATNCIHCGYPLSLLNNEKAEDTVSTKQSLAKAEAENKEYSFKIINCNGSNAKVIITLKNVFQYSLDDAKAAVKNLPLTFSTTRSITEVKQLAQEFTDAGIDYEVFDGKKKITLNLVEQIHNEASAVKPASSHPEERNVSNHKEDNDSGSGCFVCLIIVGILVAGGMFLLTDGFSDFALWWLVFPLTFAALILVGMIYSFATSDPKEVKENWDREKYSDYKFACPMCGSKKVKKIGTANRAVSIATVGLASSKIGKQYECDACKHKW